jgi:hypothetical protein
MQHSQQLQRMIAATTITAIANVGKPPNSAIDDATQEETSRERLVPGTRIPMSVADECLVALTLTHKDSMFTTVPDVHDVAQIPTVPVAHHRHFGSIKHVEQLDIAHDVAFAVVVVVGVL